MTIELYSHQQEAVEKLRNGNILCGGVGTGKSRTAIAYFFVKVCGGCLDLDKVSFKKNLKTPRDLYIITTARKRDTFEWDEECSAFLLSNDPENSIGHVKVTVDSWNNVSKYTKVKDAFFIFDEQRVVGYGQWSKSFIKISRQNQWILLTATPGDNWSDYIPVFIANGFYKNKTDFERQHAVYSRFTKYPKIERYVGLVKLTKQRDAITVPMEFRKPTIAHHINRTAFYDKMLYHMVMKDRWNPYANEPIQEISSVCYLLRRIVNSDISRYKLVEALALEHKKVIIFYNFNYELDILKQLPMPVAEWNGHRHDPIPETDTWAYLVQYVAGAEGWNCTLTDTTIFYSQSYSYKTMIQAAGRIDRLNTPFTNLYYFHLMSDAPIDKAINKALGKKKNFNEKKFIV